MSAEAWNERVTLALPGVAFGSNGRTGVPGTTSSGPDIATPDALVMRYVHEYFTPFCSPVIVMFLTTLSALVVVVGSDPAALHVTATNHGRESPRNSDGKS